MKRRRLVSLAAGTMLAMSAALLALSSTAMAQSVVYDGDVAPNPVAQTATPTATTGNAGDVKIHDGAGEPASEPANDPTVCTFHLHWFNFDAGQSGSWHITAWEPTGDNSTVVLSGSYLTDSSGEYRLPATGTYSLPNGHYKLFWQGINDNSDKQKVFWVECATPTPSATATATATVGCVIDDLVGPNVPAPLCPTATPTATATATATNFVEGFTAFPSATTPSTTTGGGSHGNSTPLLAIAICLAFGGLGLLAVEYQRGALRN